MTFRKAILLFTLGFILGVFIEGLIKTDPTEDDSSDTTDTIMLV